VNNISPFEREKKRVECLSQWEWGKKKEEGVRHRMSQKRENHPHLPEEGRHHEKSSIACAKNWTSENLGEKKGGGETPPGTAKEKKE